MNRTGFVSVMLVGFLFAASLFAHHGNGAFEMSKVVTMTGAITRVELVNPHSIVYIDVKNQKGALENWALVGSAPNLQLRNGLKEILKPGVMITVAGFLPRMTPGTTIESAFAYSNGATEKLKTGHLLQVGDLRLDGQNYVFGMGPQFSSK